MEGQGPIVQSLRGRHWTRYSIHKKTRTHLKQRFRSALGQSAPHPLALKKSGIYFQLPNVTPFIRSLPANATFGALEDAVPTVSFAGFVPTMKTPTTRH